MSAAQTKETIVSQEKKARINKGDILDRFVNSQPILKMLKLISKTGRDSFHDKSAWEVCLCALIMRIDPNCSIHRILEALPQSRTPMDAASFLNTMANLGYTCMPCETAINEIDTRLLPAVFITRRDEVCIILGRNKDEQLQFYDPITKLISHTPPIFDHEGRIWFFKTYDENLAPTSKFMRKGSGHSWFIALLGRFKKTFAQVMVTGLFLNILALLTPLFIMLIYDRVIATSAQNVLPMIAMGAFIAIGFELRLRLIRAKGLSWLSGRLDNIVSNKIFAHLIGLSPRLIEKASVAAQIARIKTFESVRDFFSGSLFMTTLELPFVLLSVLAISLIAGPLVLIPLSAVGIYIGLFYVTRQKIKTAIRLAAKRSSIRQQFSIETFEKLGAIQGHGLQQKWQEKYRHVSGNEAFSHFKLGFIGMVCETIAHSITVLAAVATVGMGAHLIWQGSMTSGALVASMILVWRILTPFYSLCTMVPRLEQLRNSIQQVNNLIDIDTEEEETKSYSTLPNIKGDISFQNVEFRYADDGNEIFSDLNFEIKRGSIAIINGTNGTGKSAVLKLIKCLYQPNRGTVKIDGFDIRQLNPNDLRQKIAYASRNPHFYEGSIADNLRLSYPLVSEKELEIALKKADVWEDVQSMPDGINTVIGTHNGAHITHNFASRLSLARIYLHPGSIVLIDELPNTLLSSKAGRNLKEHLAEVKGKKTVILCSFRRDYMELADTIVWLRGILPPLAGERDTIIDQMGETSYA